MTEVWAPELTDVARHIPTRTRDSTSPGSDTLLGTFTANTTPTDTQAQQIIDDTVAALVADVGEMPTADALTPEIQVAAKQAAEWRAAADIEIAYPNRDADIRTYAALDARAGDALDTLKRVLAEHGAGIVDAYPEWAMPDPPPWGDESFGSGTNYFLRRWGWQ